MSNFNLISPEGNGYNFNVRFDEPIIVPENASVHLNWGQFERDNAIVFTKNQTITLKNPQILPIWNWKEGKVDGSMTINGIEKNAGDFTFSIPKGKYSLESLQTAIVNAFCVDDKTICKSLTEDRTGVDDSLIGIDNPSLKLLDFQLICPRYETDPNHLEMGFIVNNKPKAFLPDMTNKHNVSVDDPADASDIPTGIVLKNAGASGTFTNGLPDQTAYNAYCMGRRKYNHSGGHFQQYIGGFATKGNVMKNGGFDELENLNTINFVSNKNFEDTSGSTFVGLYIQGYAGANGDTSVIGGNDGTAAVSDDNDPLANRIHGATMIAKRSQDGTGGYYPKCHFGVEYTGFNVANLTNGQQDRLNIINAEMGTQADGTINMENTILGMNRVYSIKLSTYRDPDDDSPFSFGIQTYYDRGNSNKMFSGADKGDLHIRVYIQNVDGTSIVVYDTNTKYPHRDVVERNQYFTKKFMQTYWDTTEASTITLAQAQSTIPFVPIISSTQDGEGGRISYSQIEDLMPVAPNEQNSFLQDYQLEISNELGNLFTPLGTDLTYLSSVLSPAYINFSGANNYMNNEVQNIFLATLGQNEFYFRDNNVLGQYRQDKFSIILNNLPIKSYKNTNDKSKSGYRKPILANIPNPFSSADVGIGNQGKILGSYQSSLGIVNRLSNQAMTTNNFDVEIRNLETDKPAEQLTKSIINFTINAD